jgi:soluble lytic murein transglycosylase
MSATGESRAGGSVRTGLALFLLAAIGCGLVGLVLAARAAPPAQLARAVEKGESDAAGSTAPAAGTDGATAPAVPAVIAAERRFKAALDKVLAPLAERPLTKEDAERLREAFRVISAGGVANGQRLAAELTDPVARKLVAWHLVRSGYGTAETMQAFLAENPAWPDRAQIVQRMEEATFVQGGAAREIKAFFAKHPPRTGLGHAALASAHLIDGEKERAREAASRAWREHDLPNLLETGFLERFRELLGEADHKERFDRISIEEPRWASRRNARLAVARRMLPLLSPAERTKAEARLAVLARAGNAAALMAAAGETAGGSDLGFAYHRAQLARRAGHHAEAAKLLTAAHIAPEKLVNPDAWWVERRAVAYALLAAGDARSAYALAALEAPLSVNPRKDRAFTAGWIALRHLGDAAKAAKHFADMREAADGPLSRAQSGYWSARAALAAKDEAKARRHHEEAAKNFDTFYGQLSRALMERGELAIEIRPPAMASEAEIARFTGSDATVAALLAHKAGLGRGVTRTFFNHMRATLKSEAEMALAAHLAESFGDVQMAVRIGKSAIARGQNLVYYSYPLHAFPSFEPLRALPETALLLAIARQESEFNNEIVSGAGARGLMQVMPITARHVCKDYRLTCNIPRLLTDNAYNARIASAYVGDRMRDFGGSYLLTIAGYNAGPGRARQWIRRFGDPRSSGVDPLDWIHSIPFEETREYVQKVLSNLQIYRARLGEARPALRLIDDLARGSARARRKTRPTATPTTAN